MTSVLLAKELRALRPMAACILGLFASGTVYLFVTELPDGLLLDPNKWLGDGRHDTFFAVALFSLMIGAVLLVQESEQGTLHFLDGLPVSRTRIFIVKTCAALLVLACVPLLNLVTDVLFDRFSRSSVDGPFPWTFSGAIFLLQMVAGAYLLALAMVVSFVRSWFALVAGLLLWGYLWLRASGVHWLALLDTHALLALDVSGGGIGLPWRGVVAHAGATLVLLAVAWLGFRSLGDGAQRAAERFERSRALHALAAGMKLLAPVVCLGALMYVAGAFSLETPSSAPVGEQSFARVETKHYEFLLRRTQRKDAGKLLRDADDIHDRVTTFIGAASPPARIVVDLASPVMPHVAGQTHWTKIRMPLHPGQSFPEQRRILAHETAHVVMDQLGDGRLVAHFRSIRALNEGLATHVELTLFATREEQAKHRRDVAAAWSRGPVPFALLTDDDALGEQRDPDLVYPLGAELARVLLEREGPDAAARLLRAFAGQPVRPKAEGVGPWRAAMQSAGLGYERVAAAYETECATLAEEEKEFTAGLPRLSADVKIEGREIVIRPTFAGKAPGRIVCMIENDMPLGWPTRALAARADGSFALDRASHSRPRLRYLLGWQTDRTRAPVFEPWSEATPHR